MGSVGRSIGAVVRAMSAVPALAAGALVAGACGLMPDGLGVDGPDRDESGRVVAAGEVAALDIQVGDCFDDGGDEAVEAVMVVPCADPHDYEVFHAFDLADGAFPGADAVEKRWMDGCLAEFEAFVGAPFDESVLDISAIFPTRETWNELGDREVLCSVTGVDGMPRTGSAQDSGL